MNIPIYRAKKIGSDGYVIGYYSPAYDIHHYIITDLGVDTKVNVVYQMSTNIHKIDPTTLAIHFPNMTDSQANKIFASFSEDGKGGDKFLFDNEIFIIWFDNQSLKINATNKDNFESNCHDSLNEWYDFTNKCYDLKVLGIQE